MAIRILVPYYTQSGQLREILNYFTAPLMDAGVEVEFLQNRTKKPFPFPWTKPEFFDTVPESVDGVATELEPWQTRHDHYDLIIWGWQPWNLNPSIPSSSLLQDPRFQALIKDTPVITISGCRNMWINAQERNKALLQAAGARLVGNIALVDRHLNHLSYYTIFHWLGTGKKTRKWGIFPLPGVAEADIRGASRYGELLLPYLEKGDYTGLQPALLAAGAVPVKYSLMFIERKAGKIFKKWVQLIRKHPEKRTQILVLYKHYLAVALLVASPLILLVDALLFRPFSGKKNRRLLAYYRSVDFKEQI
ncbi:hypothetical protein GCM10027051_18710 [Niabella terrae]